MDTTTHSYMILQNLRVLIGSVIFLFVMVTIVFVIQQRAITESRHATECLLAQQLQHRYATRDADVKTAEALGYDYHPPAVVASPTLDQVELADKKLLSACNSFIKTKKH